MRLSTTVPALPVQDIDVATAFYEKRYGFTCGYSDIGFARLRRDDAEINLWASSDAGWKTRSTFATSPIESGAESFLAGTASCRIEVDLVDELYVELSRAGVLHPVDRGSPEDTEWGTREFATLDLEGNLLTFYAIAR